MASPYGNHTVAPEAEDIFMGGNQGRKKLSNLLGVTQLPRAGPKSKLVKTRSLTEPGVRFQPMSSSDPISTQPQHWGSGTCVPYLAFYVGVGDSNSGLHASIASTLTH